MAAPHGAQRASSGAYQIKRLKPASPADRGFRHGTARFVPARTAVAAAPPGPDYAPTCSWLREPTHHEGPTHGDSPACVRGPEAFSSETSQGDGAMRAVLMSPRAASVPRFRGPPVLRFSSLRGFSPWRRAIVLSLPRCNCRLFTTQ
jgi:hypothetical protein